MLGTNVFIFILNESTKYGTYLLRRTRYDQFLINIKIERNINQKEYNEWIRNNGSSLTEIRFGRQYIQYIKKKNEMKIINILLLEKKQKIVMIETVFLVRK